MRDFSTFLASAETRPLTKVKLPTPRSIKPYPKVSVLANLLGNTGKSTARMAMVVKMIMKARWLLTKADLLGSSGL